ncbi:MAG: right-handed parallel beta-helix repeat-containing protein [Firmicutes bacterium]|nr:right-handed parallel beta-helix repeat-containing protein [Bacillota bacterium]
MKKKNLLRMLILALVLVLAVAASGCGGETGNNPEDNPPDDPVINDPVDNDPVIDNPVEDDSIHVSSTEELFAAIAPGAKIVIEPGYYNMSEFVETFDHESMVTWNQENPYIRLEECFDGNDVFIRNVDGLSIAGGGENFSDTEIVVEPRYAAILSFENCKDIEISNITMGHTMQSDCSGNVLNFFGCDNVNLDKADLYGCGVIGINAKQNCGDITVTDSIIRDCSYGPIEIAECQGRYEFRNCVFKGSMGGGYYEKSGSSELCFYDCEFGSEETNIWYFYEDIVAENCEWGEITQYPDYGW